MNWYRNLLNDHFRKTLWFSFMIKARQKREHYNGNSQYKLLINVQDAGWNEADIIEAGTLLTFNEGSTKRGLYPDKPLPIQNADALGPGCQKRQPRSWLKTLFAAQIHPKRSAAVTKEVKFRNYMDWLNVNNNGDARLDQRLPPPRRSICRSYLTTRFKQNRQA